MPTTGPIRANELEQILSDLRDFSISLTEIGAKFGRKVSTIRRVARENGIQLPPPRVGPPALALPADFRGHAHVSSSPDLMKRYGVSIGIITRWRKETGIVGPKFGKPFLPISMPAGFALSAPTMTMKQLRLRYGRSADVIHRWLTEAKVKPKKLQAGYRNGPINAVQRDMTAIGQVADYLRRWGPVFRCNAEGRADTKGMHWRRGLAVLTDAELTERAIAKGYDAKAWERIAA